jgi:hypothetical protein
MADKKDKENPDEVVNMEELRTHIKNTIANIVQTEGENEGDEPVHAPYDHRESAVWTRSILQTVMDKCIALKKPFKYAANCVVFRRTEASVQMCVSSSAGPADNVIVEKFDINPNVWCVVTLFYVAI